MRILIPLMTLLAQPALAHPGHIAEVAGHGHWIALGAIGLAAVVGALGARKRAKEKAETAPDQEADAEPSAA
ncbi:DUF6732 family protein [Pelagovum pacificum]|uniref:LPXTG cell wall anchor domain-containing protein n=1 Tax=Pelagovum pacificum TaxID=2588711 RepID=A0A5C5GFY6_9RHOB|nr:DUF6732 family protein [Pelagovum pacificum]QQA43194.1 hypothetical protein I8N54_01075 [Pelagovum pacificum]TNY33665.1 hypothetical protein FHY64_10445 [Pelagovum pacificum]